MKIQLMGFGSIEINNRLYNHDVVIDQGSINKRKKGKSRELKRAFGHTPLTAYENIPWNCDTLIIGSGYYGSLPVSEDIHEEARKRKIDIKIMKTAEACSILEREPERTNAVLHITC